jgi:hypothetical protein
MTEPICPKCGDNTWRESADVGVGIIYGPYGCPSCGWSEEDRYDLSSGHKTEDGYRLDQWGGLHKTNMSFNITQWQNSKELPPAEFESLPPRAFLNLIDAFMGSYRFYEDDVVRVEFKSRNRHLEVTLKSPFEQVVTVVTNGVIKLHLEDHGYITPHIRKLSECCKDGCKEMGIVEGYCEYHCDIRV